LIKNYAEARGFRATQEAPLAEGGAVDVLLERDDLSLACEISVTTDASHELNNVRKCLNTAATRVLAISSNAQSLRRLRHSLHEDLSPEAFARVDFLSPQQVIALLDELPASGDAEQATVLGYKVKTTVHAPDSETQQRRQSIASTIIGALRRTRKR